MAGDVVKYGVDAGTDFIQGNKVRDFDVTGALHNAAFDLAWGGTVGRLVFKPFEKAIKEGLEGGKLIGYNSYLCISI